MSWVYYSGGGIWTSRESRGQYLRRVIPYSYYPGCEFIADHLPADSRLLIAGDSRSLYYTRPFVTDLGYEKPFLVRLFQDEGDLDRVRLKMKEAGFTHLVVNVGEGIQVNSKYPQYNLTSRQWELLNEYFEKGLDEIFHSGPIVIYEVRSHLKERPDVGQVNPILFFSEPVIRYLQAKRDGREKEAEVWREKISELYPFARNFAGLLSKGFLP
jgi:hypothetical protein